MMKKKLITIVLALLMTMMFSTAGVFAAPENNNENSDYWKVEATEVTDSSVVLVWNPADDKDYDHSDDAVFNIYEVSGEDKELIAENIMSEKAAAEIVDNASEEVPLVYVYNDNAKAKDDNGKEIPLGYSFVAEKLDPSTDYELIIEKTEKEEDQNTFGNVAFKTKEGVPETSKKVDESVGDDESVMKSGGKKLNLTKSSAYSLSKGESTPATPNTAVFNWEMNQELQDGARVDINGYKVTPTKNSDGTYSYTVAGFNPERTYKIPVKVVDKKGNTLSNVIYIAVDTSYKLSVGKSAPVTPGIARFVWKMDREPSGGAKVDINGYKVTPTNNGDGTYSYNVAGFNPSKTYRIPVKVVDKNGRTISNVIKVPVNPHYVLSAGKVTEVTPNTAVFNWKMNHALEDGARVDINGYKVTPTKNSDGTYSYTVGGFSHSHSYKIPVKIVDSNGRVLSNVLSIAVNTPYTLSEGKVISYSGKTAVFNWKISHPLKDGATVDINGYKVTPTKNSDGTYSYTVGGFNPSKSYSIPVKIVDKNGKTVSNVMYVQVEFFDSTIKTMQLSITFGEGVSLTDHTNGTTTKWFPAGFKTTTVGSVGNEETGGFYYFNYGGKLYRVKWSRISSVSIASSAFDKTYSASAATNFVNKLNISSSTGVLIWVNTYTQKEYIFTGSNHNWRLSAGPWSVTTGKPYTPTQTGVGTISDKDPEQNGLPYWSVVQTFSFHGKLSSWSLGYPQSNGCVRNSNDHAYHIYYNCPIGTAVYVY